MSCQQGIAEQLGTIVRCPRAPCTAYLSLVLHPYLSAPSAHPFVGRSFAPDPPSYGFTVGSPGTWHCRRRRSASPMVEMPDPLSSTFSGKHLSRALPQGITTPVAQGYFKGSTSTAPTQLPFYSGPLTRSTNGTSGSVDIAGRSVSSSSGTHTVT